MSRTVIEKDGVCYTTSLVDGSIYFIFIGDRQYKITWTDENGYEAHPYTDFDFKGNMIIYSSLRLHLNHVEQLNKLKHKL